MEHPLFQRLRHITQLGLSSYVYPGAVHSRFHHALGAMHLMQRAIHTLKSKGVDITDEEHLAVSIAILLHDVGHGPFSHALEYAMVENVHHEEISVLMMERLNEEFDGQLSMAIEIFKGTYSKGFLHQLVSSQLDMDRLDYLSRDSFFTGVHEGVIGYDRIIKMLNVQNDELVVEAKGVYSIEKFLISRRLMYWQVYLHHTVLVAEILLVKILKRAKELIAKGDELYASPALNFFLKNEVNLTDFKNERNILNTYAQLDDHDLFSAFKVWMEHKDLVLSELCKGVVRRKMLKIRLQAQPFNEVLITKLVAKTSEQFGISIHEAQYFTFADSTSNRAYIPDSEHIKILFKDGELVDITEASDHLNIQQLSTPVVKYYLCYPKELEALID
ncbi:UNVERIFIED_CONTAM: hypothetical protein GTU68_033105 [Idotea baltica]|nr:hypothetical protein [Idotea baltica]